MYAFYEWMIWNLEILMRRYGDTNCINEMVMLLTDSNMEIRCNRVIGILIANRIDALHCHVGTGLYQFMYTQQTHIKWWIIQNGKNHFQSYLSQCLYKIFLLYTDLHNICLIVNDTSEFPLLYYHHYESIINV